MSNLLEASEDATIARGGLCWPCPPHRRSVAAGAICMCLRESVLRMEITQACALALLLDVVRRRRRAKRARAGPCPCCDAAVGCRHRRHRLYRRSPAPPRARPAPHTILSLRKARLFVTPTRHVSLSGLTPQPRRYHCKRLVRLQVWTFLIVWYFTVTDTRREPGGCAEDGL